MGTLIFPIDDTLRSIVAHTQANPEMGSYYGTEIPPSLYLVKDHGAYLMSASKEPQLLTPKMDDFRRVVAYAIGHDPNKDTYDWDFTRGVCGGDDFGEPIPVDWFVKVIGSGCTEIHIRLDGDQIGLSGRLPGDTAVG